MMTASRSTRGFRDLPWRVLITIVPLGLAVLLLQLLAPETTLLKGLSRTASLASLWSIEGYPSGLIGYAAAVCAHVLLCLSVIIYYCRCIRRFAPASSLFLTLFALAYGLVAATVVVGSYNPKVAAYLVTFANFEALYPPDSAYLRETFFGVSRLYFAASVPTVFGILAVTFGAMASESLLTGLAFPPVAFTERQLERRIASFKRCFQALSLVLVSSAFTASLFFHLPIRLFKGKAQGLIEDYAGEISIFWGTVYTLTLLAAFAPQFLLLRRAVQEFVGTLEHAGPSETVPAWLQEKALFGSLTKQTAILFTLLAPLLTGPIGNVLQTITP